MSKLSQEKLLEWLDNAFGGYIADIEIMVSDIKVSERKRKEVEKAYRQIRELIEENVEKE